MGRVDFYLLSQEGKASRQTFACRLAEKAWRMENRVHIHTRDADDARRMDDLLWTFRDGSFVPHAIATGPAAEDPTPITISCQTDGIEPRDLLINLCDEVPVFAGAFPRVAELVSSDEPCKKESRKRFATYRDQGYTLETHNV